jgi:hypothetical protein
MSSPACTRRAGHDQRDPQQHHHLESEHDPILAESRHSTVWIAPLVYVNRADTSSLATRSA